MNILHVLLLIFQQESPGNKNVSPIVNRPQGTGGGENANPPLEMTFSLLNHSFDSFGENMPQLDVNTNSFAGADAPAASSFGGAGVSYAFDGVSSTHLFR